jgi:hypothetical protein
MAPRSSSGEVKQAAERWLDLVIQICASYQSSEQDSRFVRWATHFYIVTSTDRTRVHYKTVTVPEKGHMNRDRVPDKL